MTWKNRFYSKLRGSPDPVIAFESGIISGANIWSGARAWTRLFRELGLVPGDRVIIAVAPSPAYLWIVIACLCEGICACPIPPGLSNQETLLEELDAALLISDGNLDAPHVLRTSRHEIPEGPQASVALRPRRLPPMTEIQVLLRTSGSTGQARFAALTGDNLARVVDTHHRYVNFSNMHLVSVLPWHHAFGFTLELLPLLTHGGVAFRDPEYGKNADRVLELLKHSDATHINAVPALLNKMSSREGDLQSLHNLTGIIGGAPADTRLAGLLNQTRLRVGYGQTEAGPGICLGRPGEWEPFYLGRPLGCRTRISDEGELAFRGRNGFLGFWQADGLHRRTDHWVPTGDLVEQRGRKLYFRGRRSQSFKLPNGKWFHPTLWEDRLRERTRDSARVFLDYDPRGGIRVFSDDAQLLSALTGTKGAELFPPLEYIIEMRQVASSFFVDTPKGDANRPAMRASLLKQ